MTDFQLDDDYDQAFDDTGDLAIGPADEDNINIIAELIPGQLRYAPEVGWAAVLRKNGEITQEDIADLRQQLAADGYTSVTISYDNGTLTIKNV